MLSLVINDEGVVVDDGTDAFLTQWYVHARHWREVLPCNWRRKSNSDSMQSDSDKGQSGRPQVSNKVRFLKQLMRALCNNGLIIV